MTFLKFLLVFTRKKILRLNIRREILNEEKDYYFHYVQITSCKPLMVPDIYWVSTGWSLIRIIKTV